MKKVLTLVLLAAATSCAGIRENGDGYTAHAECLNVLGFQIPGNDIDAAWELVPEGATVETVHSTPSDWTSVVGVLNRVLGVGVTEISGTK